MGQKVHPVGIRLGITKDWQSKWFARNNYAEILQADIKLRQYLEKKLGPAAAVSGIEIARLGEKRIIVKIKTGRPGNVIGKKGDDIENLRKKIASMVGMSTVNLQIEEVRKPEIDSKLVADSIAQQLERRIMFRRAMKRAVSSALRAGALGVKICLSGRLGGAEIARTEWYREGRVPLHTFRADIDYATSVAKTTYGIIGVKVWIFKGEVLKHAEQQLSEEKQ